MTLVGLLVCILISKFPLRTRVHFSSSMATSFFSTYKSFFFFFLLLLLLLFSSIPRVRSGDAEALLALKVSIDPMGVLQWEETINVCKWQGVKECLNGRVIKLVVERFNMSGTLDGKSLNQLDQLRVLSFKQNSLSGQIPQLSGLANLKSLFLNDNMFSGEIPVSLSLLHRLKVVVLSGNIISGQIPRHLVDLPRLYVLYLQDNQLTGSIPPFSQNSLRFLNVSNNALSGEIPQTAPLVKFNKSSFTDNVDLCGEQIQKLCSFGPSASPSYSVLPIKNVGNRKKVVLVIVMSIGGFALLCIAAVVLVMFLRKSTSKEKAVTSKVVARDGEERTPSGVAVDDGEQESFSWHKGDEGHGFLAFLGPGDQIMSYGSEDLLKASAEMLGRGTMGSTYKAVMESGYIVTVKRLKDARYPRTEEFRRHVEILGRLRHPNLVPLRACFQAKEERLIVYDYFPNGSLFTLVHGSRASGGSKPLHWTSCLKIAEDLAAGLLYIHQSPGLTHGNLKSTNVLLGSDFESCLTDYGLAPFRNPNTHDQESSASSSLCYRAPECRDVRMPLTQQADVYNYGVLLLELMTGKTPFQDLAQQNSSDITKWVRSMREEETKSRDDPTASGNEAFDGKLSAILNIATACVSLAPESRPAMRDVLRMIREARAEARISSNSSADQSPGRWSDTVQSLSREDHSTI